MRITKKWWWLFAICIISGIVLMLLTTHNQSFYRRPIAQVIATKQVSRQKTSDEFKNVDHLTTQHLRVKLLNGRYRGRQLTVINHYTDSGAMDQHYRVGNQLFLTQLHHTSKRHLAANVSDLKRDYVLVFLIWLTVVSLLLMMRWDGLRTVLSLVANSVLFILAIELDKAWQGADVLAIFSTLAVLFTIISLAMILGPTKRMVATSLATLAGTFLALGISFAVFSLTNERGIHYESMLYVTQVQRPLFLAETLLGSLGAVMDVSSDIVATLFQFHRLNPTSSFLKLFLAGRDVGKTVMGPLVNTLFMIFMAMTFTSAVLLMRNGNSWGYTFSMSMCLGTAQSLISGIGIVLAIPVASGLMAWLLTKGGVKHVHD
ncbi:YibE/F family protein [Limosilactobacillus sp.]|uniref:YibE/F family protein n=1 Tax=Limosilactobacillus sp. TaxID=2773925 RepID=UPI00345E07E5